MTIKVRPIRSKPMKKISLNQENLPSPSRTSLAWRGLSRRRFFRSAAGTGTELLLGSKIAPAWADGAAHPFCPVVPRPIPHINHPPGPGAHFFFPGHVDGSPSVTDPAPDSLASRDPSIITYFSCLIAQADLNLSGTGTNLNTGASATYDFHCDMRFMSGVFVGLDNQQHNGNIGFI